MADFNRLLVLSTALIAQTACQDAPQPTDRITADALSEAMVA